MFFLDTTAIIELFKGNERLKRVLEEKGDGSAVTAVSYFEIFTGIIHKRLKREETYFTRFFANVPVYHFEMKAAQESSRLMASLLKRGASINMADVMIAGITIANGGEGIVTKDRDFERIEEIADLDIVFV